MEDWEQFFVDKSRRRFAKERFEQRRRWTRAILGGAIVTVIIVVGIISLAASVSAG